MKQRSKKVIAISLVLTMVCTMVCGCKKSDRSGEISGETYKFLDESGETIGVRFHGGAECFSAVTNMDMFYKGLSICIDRVYAREQMTGGDADLVQTAFMKEQKCDATMSGVLNCEDTMEILEDCGLSFVTRGDGTYSCIPDLVIPFEVAEGDDQAYRLAELVKADLGIIGIVVEIKVYPVDEYTELIQNDSYHLIATVSDESNEDTGYIPLWKK